MIRATNNNRCKAASSRLQKCFLPWKSFLHTRDECMLSCVSLHASKHARLCRVAFHGPRPRTELFVFFAFTCLLTFGSSSVFFGMVAESIGYGLCSYGSHVQLYGRSFPQSLSVDHCTVSKTFENARHVAASVNQSQNNTEKGCLFWMMAARKNRPASLSTSCSSM